MRSRGVPQSQLARQTGLSVAAICHYVKGTRYPTARNMALMAAALDVSVEQLMGTQPEKQADRRAALNSAINLVAENNDLLTDEDRYRLFSVIIAGKAVWA